MYAKYFTVSLVVLIAATAAAEIHIWSNPEVEMWNTYYPTTEVLDIIVTTEKVAAAGKSWSAVKALYR